MNHSSQFQFFFPRRQQIPQPVRPVRLARPRTYQLSTDKGANPGHTEATPCSSVQASLHGDALHQIQLLQPLRLGHKAGRSAHGRACSSKFHPSSRRRSLRTMASMAAVATSAALPWMGVLIAARSAWPCVAPVYEQTYGPR